MAALHTPDLALNTPAPGFTLPDVHGKPWTLEDCRGKAGLLVVFMCNHCPYVKAIIHELVADLTELEELGVNSVAIMSNDVSGYPEDSPENMKALADEQDFTFPYCYDESQDVAKAYGAVCTPDFFGYNANLQLQYRGRFDSSGVHRQSPRSERELYNAMKLIAETGQGPKEQKPSIGCSIKWQ